MMVKISSDTQRVFKPINLSMRSQRDFMPEKFKWLMVLYLYILVIGVCLCVNILCFSPIKEVYDFCYYRHK